jgi:hypothetical protein
MRFQRCLRAALASSLVASAGLLTLAPAACSATAGDDQNDASGSGSDGSDGNLGFSDDDIDSAVDSCAAETYAGEVVDLDMFVMLDRSGSMQDGNKWPSVVGALNEFVSAPESSGIGVGLGYFPTPPSGPIPRNCADCGNYGPCLPVVNQCAGSITGISDSCDAVDYAAPALGIAPLPATAAAFQSALAGQGPDGASTPSQPALEGAAQYATQWAKAHPAHLTFIVFATDGEPTNCSNNSVQGTAAAAAEAGASSPAVRTFVIGVGDSLGALNQIAAAGGTDTAFVVDAGAGTTQQFIDALVAIRGLGQCKFQIPVPDSGEPDFNLVNVSFVDAATGAETPLANVPSAADCDPAGGGWYYDNPSAPKIIELCPQSCDHASSSSVDVQVKLGCKTLVK